jgi:UDP-N-acetylglucosamine 3-dehydrogenase
LFSSFENNYYIKSKKIFLCTRHGGIILEENKTKSIVTEEKKPISILEDARERYERRIRTQKEIERADTLQKTVNFAVIGCGVWGRNHARVLSDLSNVILDSVVDIDENVASSIGDKYHVDFSTDPDKVLRNPEIDAVAICTPTVTHAKLAMRAIEEGKHVLVEKPMTNTVKEAEELIKAARSADVKLSVGFVERFNPAVRKAIELVNESTIGDIIIANTKRVSRWPVRIGDVGVIKDLAIHDIDIINTLFGIEASTVFCNAGNINHSFEDYANIMMCYPNNKAAFIETNWLTPRKVRTLTITGTKGLITVEYLTQKITIETNTETLQPLLNGGEPLRLELLSFVNSIINDDEPEVSGVDGLRALKVCEAAIESAREGKPVNNPATI